MTRRAVAIRPLVILAGAAACALPAAACATEPALRLTAVAETRVPFPAPAQVPVPRVDRPYFDAEGRLRWDDTPVQGPAAGGCDRDAPRPGAGGTAPPPPPRNRLRMPRVDERRCPGGGSGTQATLLGLDEKGALVWQRPLAFPSGGTAMDEWLIGASPEGLVLSSLEVWSPATGATLVPARAHPVGPDSRPVPDHQFQGAALYDPGRRQVYLFDADVTLLRRAGGLHRFDPARGSLELLQEVSGGWAGTYDRVEAMALSPDGRHLFLARQRSTRGPAFVSLAVFDLEARRVVFEARHGKGHYCSDPQVVAGPGGQVGLSYRDANLNQHVLVHYRIQP